VSPVERFRQRAEEQEQERQLAVKAENEKASLLKPAWLDDAEQKSANSSL